MTSVQSRDMSSTPTSPSFREYVKLANWAKFHIFTEESTEEGKILVCNCSKCQHEETKKPLRINLETNLNIQNTIIQHFKNSGCVKISYKGIPYIDQNMVWSPEKGWSKPDAGASETKEDQSISPKIDPALSQEKPEADSKSPSGEASVKTGKTYRAVAATQHGPESLEEEKEDDSEEEKSPMEVYFSPGLTTERCADGQLFTAVHYFHTFQKIGDDIREIKPGENLPTEYTPIKTPVDEKNGCWFTPIIVYDADFKKKISFVPKIVREPNGTLRYCM